MDNEIWFLQATVMTVVLRPECKDSCSLCGEAHFLDRGDARFRKLNFIIQKGVDITREASRKLQEIWII